MIWLPVHFEILARRVFHFKNIRKYKGSAISETQLSELDDKLDEIMSKERPYLDPNLNLSQLAELLESD